MIFDSFAGVFPTGSGKVPMKKPPHRRLPLVLATALLLVAAATVVGATATTGQRQLPAKPKPVKVISLCGPHGEIGLPHKQDSGGIQAFCDPPKLIERTLE